MHPAALAFFPGGRLHPDLQPLDVGAFPGPVERLVLAEVGR